jgi:hypothetical protein
MLTSLGQARVDIEQAQASDARGVTGLALWLPGLGHQLWGAHFGAHFGAHLLAPHFAFSMLFLGAHLPARFAPHFAIAALGAHFAGAFVSCAAAGNAKVAAVRAARDASFNDVFMTVPR